MLVNLAVAQRLTLVSTLTGVNGDVTDSLVGLNVNELPDGALVFVKSSARLYQLVKNISPTIVVGGDVNVIAAVGSSDVNGRFVAVQQSTTVTLVGGTATATGLSLPAGQQHLFLLSYTAVAGTPGILHAVRATDHSVTVTSSSGTDTSTVLIVAVSTGD